MYKELSPSEVLEMFTQAGFDFFVEKAMEGIMECREKNNLVGPHITGTYGLKDFPTMEGKTINIWVVYTGEILGPNFVSGGIRRFCIFDEITDEIMDEYNALKKKAEEAQAQEIN